MSLEVACRFDRDQCGPESTNRDAIKRSGHLAILMGLAHVTNANPNLAPVQASRAMTGAFHFLLPFFFGFAGLVGERAFARAHRLVSSDTCRICSRAV